MTTRWYADARRRRGADPWLMTEQPGEQNPPTHPDSTEDKTPADGRGVEITTGEPNAFEPEEDPGAEVDAED
jgi:hypothetical protein